MTPAQPQLSGQPISNSTFYMWRCVIAVAHADGVVHDAERAYIKKIIANMDRVYGLTPEQKATFASDLDSSQSQSIPELLSHINEPACRGQLIYFGGLMARAGGVPDPREEDILKKLRIDQMASLNMAEINAHVKEAVNDEMFRHDLAMQEIHPQRGLFSVLDRFLSWQGISLTDNDVD